MENASSSFDKKKKDKECVEDSSVMEEGHISTAPTNSTTKNVGPDSAAAAANGSSASPCEDQNVSFTRNSPKNTSDDDNGTVGKPTYRTLPGRCLSPLKFYFIYINLCSFSYSYLETFAL